MTTIPFMNAEPQELTGCERFRHAVIGIAKLPKDGELCPVIAFNDGTKYLMRTGDAMELVENLVTTILAIGYSEEPKPPDVSGSDHFYRPRCSVK